MTRRHAASDARRKACQLALIVSSFLFALLLVARHTGIPFPASVLSGYKMLGNPAFYMIAKYVGVRTDKGRVLRAFTDGDGERGYMLQHAVSRDSEGREVCRVENGNGALFLYHDNGLPAKLEFYSGGLTTGLYVLWSNDGGVRQFGSPHYGTGELLSWGFCSGGSLRYFESREP